MTRGGHEILTVAQGAAADRAAEAAGTPRMALMERAGQAVAARIAARWTPRTTLVLCGRGEIGGDGYDAPRALPARAWPVRVAAVAERSSLKGAAAEAAAGWSGPGEPIGDAAVGEAELIVDALFGAGLARALEPPLQSLLEACEARLTPIVSVDLPSGLAGDSGRPLGYAPHATLTVTFHRKKPAHVLEPGRSLCGELAVADIGLPAPEHSRLWENHPDLWLEGYPWPRTDTYKGERGRLIVIGGHAGQTGAARLAARAGLRVGAGLVTLLCPPDALSINATQLEAVMVKPIDSEPELSAAAGDADAAVIGPAAGVTPRTRLNLLTLARTDAALVVDADVLSAFKEQPETLFAALDGRDVLTPHPGEFERIFPGLLKVSPERIAAARAAAVRAGAVVVLKGADTVVAAPDGRAVVNGNATPWLATAGSGDVLAGIAAGLMAQGRESFEAACTAVWMHAEAGRTFGPGLIAEDLPEQLPAVLRGLAERRRAGEV